MKHVQALIEVWKAMSEMNYRDAGKVPESETAKRLEYHTKGFLYDRLANELTKAINLDTIERSETT